MQKHIHRYIREDGKLVGVIMGTKLENGEVIITSAKAAISKGDVFNKQFGKQLCMDRAEAYYSKNRTPVIYERFEEDVEKFVDNCKKYFKVDEVDITYCM